MSYAIPHYTFTYQEFCLHKDALNKKQHDEDDFGYYVWIGRNVKMFGGTEVGDGRIIGGETVTSASFPSNAIIAGSPRRIIREQIIWSKDNMNTEHISIYEEYKDQEALKYLD